MKADEKGIVLMVTLLMLSLMSLLGAAFLTMALTEMNVAKNQVEVVKAFNIGEAGLEATKAQFKQNNAISLFAQNQNQTITLITPTAFAGGTYTATATPCTPIRAQAADLTGCTPAGTNLAPGHSSFVVVSVGRYGLAVSQVSALLEVWSGGGSGNVQVLGWWEK